MILSLSSGDWLEAQSAVFTNLECIIITAIIYSMFHAGQVLCSAFDLQYLLTLPNHPVLDVTLRHWVKYLEIGGEGLKISLPDSKAHGQVHALNYNIMLHCFLNMFY